MGVWLIAGAGGPAPAPESRQKAFASLDVVGRRGTPVRRRRKEDTPRMFQFFRRRDTLVRWFLGGLLVLVCVTLVITLIPGLTAPSSTDDVSVLATVAGDPVTALELQQQFQQISRGNRVPSEMMALYAPQLLNQMMLEKVGLYEAQRLGLMVSPTELAEQLRQMPGLFPGGQFIGSDRYRDMVEQRFGMNVSQFEEKLRDSALSDKLRRVVTDGVIVTDDQVDLEYRRRNDKVKLDYVTFKAGDFAPQVEVREDDLKAFFGRNRNRYNVPEKRDLKLLYLDQARLRDQVQVTDQDIRQAYQRDKDRYRVEDRAQVAHILLKTVGKTPPQVEELEKKAQELLQKARSGADFAELAKQNSEDTATQPKGGDLGWISRGQTVPEFEKVAFSMEPGRISDVVKTGYGLHIIKVIARQQARQLSLEDVRAQLLQQVKTEKAAQLKQQTADGLRAALRRQNKNLQAAAAELKLPVLDAPAHTRGAPLPIVGSPAPVDEAAFLLKAGEVSDVLSASDSLAVVRVEQILPAHPAELAEVRSQVEQNYRMEKAAELALNRARELADRARSLGDLKKAAAAQKLKVESSEPLNQQGSLPNLGSIAPAFEKKVGEIVGPLPVNNGQTVFVYSVAEQTFSTPEERGKSRESLRSELLDGKRNVVFQLYLESLKERMVKEGKVKVNEVALKRFTRGLQ